MTNSKYSTKREKQYYIKCIQPWVQFSSRKSNYKVLQVSTILVLICLLNSVYISIWGKVVLGKSSRAAKCLYWMKPQKNRLQQMECDIVFFRVVFRESGSGARLRFSPTVLLTHRICQQVSSKVSSSLKLLWLQLDSSWILPLYSDHPDMLLFVWLNTN